MELSQYLIGIIREVLQNGKIEEAVNNAEELVYKYNSEGKLIASNISEMNPFTNMHLLIEQLLAAISLV